MGTESRSGVPVRSGEWGERRQGGIPKAQEETFGNDRCVHFPDGGDDFVGKYIYEYQNLWNCTI